MIYDYGNYNGGYDQNQGYQQYQQYQNYGYDEPEQPQEPEEAQTYGEQYAGQYEQYGEAEGAEQYNAQDDYVPESEYVADDDPSTYQPVTVKKHGQANIVVVGVGGAGSNAVNNMVRAGIKSAEFVVMNTDLQALKMSLVDPSRRIQLGDKTTEGLGAGSNPEIGRLAAEESRERIKAALQGIDLLFITAGMGGGTGTGAAPVIAEIAKSLGILTVGVVTKPFDFEGMQRMKNAEEGIAKIKDFVDTLLVIPNEKLLKVLNPDVPFKRAFEIADDVLRQGVQSVSDVIAEPQIINLDFADVRTILSHRGLAHMGIGKGKGEKRVIDAVRGAVYSPLLESNIEGATAIIINIIGGDDIKMSEVSEACDIVKGVVDKSANIIFGMATKPDKQDLEITIIATGFVNRHEPSFKPVGAQQKSNLEQALNEAEMMHEPKPQPEVKPVERQRPEDFFQTRPSFNTYQQKAQPQEPTTSRVETPERQVPTFLRRLKNNNPEK